MTKAGFITVKMPPAVSFSATPVAACAKTPISFTSNITWNATGTGSYNWDFGDGGTANTGSATHTYTGGGSYTVKLTATNSSNCPTTDTQVNFITIYPLPGVGFYATDTAVCSIGGSTTFISTTGGSSPFSYTWDFGDGSGPSSGSPATHSYGSAGKYSVKLIATDNKGCTDSLKLNNYINVHTVSAAANVPATACVGGAVSATSVAPTTPGAALDWDFGDGYTATGTAAGHTYLTAGTYNIRLIARVGGCADTSSHTIVISPKPTASFTFAPTIGCPAPSVIAFTNTTSGSFTSSWDFGDGFTSTLTSPLHTYTYDTSYVVKLTVTSPIGCTSTRIDTVRIIHADFQAFATPFSGCAPVAINFTESITIPGNPLPLPYPSPHTSWLWNFGDGSPTTTAGAPSHTYANVGTYYATVTVTTANGCTWLDTLIIPVGSHTIPNFYAANRNICAHNNVYFFDSSVSPSGPITSWEYFFGDGGASLGPGNPTYNYAVPGTYSVTMVTNQNGCLDTVKKLAYINVGLPGSKFIYRVSCDTLGLVHFVDSSKGATSMLWRFGDGTTSNTTNPTHQYAGPGIFNVTQITYNSTTGCQDSVTSVLIINNLSINLKATDSTICVGDTAWFTPIIAGSSGVPPASVLTGERWEWTQGSTMPVCCLFDPFGNTNNVFVPTSRGQYNVVVSVKDNNNCIVTKTIPNFITVGGPVVHFKATPPLGCAPSIIVLTDTTNYVPSTHAAQLIWDFGDGTGQTITNPLGPSVTHLYTTIGSYGVKLIVKDNIGCVDSFGATNFVTISRPTAIFSSTSSNACVGSAFQFFSSSTGTGITHQWSFGDGGTSTVASPSHTYVTPGVYNIRLIVTDYAGCKDTMYKPSGVTVTVSPHASFTMDDTLNVCPPLFVNFTNTSTGAASYQWSLGTGGYSTLTNPSATYSVPGLYPIMLIARNSLGCPDTAYGRVRVLGYPGGVLSYSPLSGCAPFTVNFQANNVDGVPGFIYNFGDGTTSATTATVMSHTYTQPGPHLPSIIMTDNLGCSATSVGIDSIKVDGVIAGFTFLPFPACDKGTIQFKDTSRGAFTPLNPPRWAFHDGTGSSLASPSKTYAGPGTYPVILYSSTTGGCKDTFRSNVIFYPLPKIIASDDTTICLSDSAILKPRGGVSYSWSPAGSLSCANCSTPFAFPAAPTTYVVTGTDANGCTNTDTVTVRLKYKTITEVKPLNTEICSGDTVSLQASTGASVYHWTPRTTLINPDSALTLAYPTASQQYVLISRYAGCLPDTDVVNVVVHPTPTVKAAPGKSIIAGTPIRLEATATGNITEWLWTPSDGLFTPTAAATDAFPKGSTTYYITVKTEFGCSATDSVRILITCDNSQVYLPNTFTPEGNGVNDIFYPRGRGISNINRFRIYNRWGEVVFERANIAVDDKSNGWDGRKGGTLLPPDVYVYIIDALCDTGEPLQWQGDVMLLR